MSPSMERFFTLHWERTLAQSPSLSYKIGFLLKCPVRDISKLSSGENNLVQFDETGLLNH